MFATAWLERQADAEMLESLRCAVDANAMCGVHSHIQAHLQEQRIAHGTSSPEVRRALATVLAASIDPNFFGCVPARRGAAPTALRSTIESKLYQFWWSTFALVNDTRRLIAIGAIGWEERLMQHGLPPESTFYANLLPVFREFVCDASMLTSIEARSTPDCDSSPVSPRFGECDAVRS